MHTFSSTCKAESVLDLFHDEAGRDTAVKWFKEHHITKLYIESYRHGRLVSEERLRIVRDHFVNAGFEVGGCITPTMLSTRNGRALHTCYTDPEALNFLQEIVELTASLFDLTILDDFLFTTCECEYCGALKGDKEWSQSRTDLMQNVSRDRILAPARAVNPNAKIIIKYPLWYDMFHERGYDVIRETEIFDYTWIGTETREPDSLDAGRRPQTSASWIQGWMNDVSNGKCGGGWYDPIDTSPSTYLEQARQTIIGGAKESLLHCYDYLGTKTPGRAIHGKDLDIKYGLADSAAFKKEATSLQFLADMLDKMTPYGILVPKNPKVDHYKQSEAYLPSFVGMLGIPVSPSATLKTAEGAFLGVQALGYDNLIAYIKEAFEEKKPMVITQGLLNGLDQKDKSTICEILDCDCHIAGDQNQVKILDINESLSLIDCSSDNWNLMDLEQDELDGLRNKLLEPYGIELYSPSKVSLHLFESDNTNCEIIENFNDFPIEAVLRINTESGAERKVQLALPQKNSASFEKGINNSYRIKIQPRSMVVLSTER